MTGGSEKDIGKSREENSELEDLKHNLRVSFSRMKDDIHSFSAMKEDIQSNKQQIEGMKGYIEDLVKTNRLLLEQVGSLKEEIKTLKKRPKGLKTELMRSLARNQKSIIKQRIIEMVGEGRFSIPELKERIVDDRNYCSKASFYRYIDELKASRKIDFLSVEGREVVVAVQSGIATATQSPEIREDFV